MLWKLECELAHPKVQLIEAFKSLIEEEKILIDDSTQKIQAILLLVGCFMISGSTYQLMDMILSCKAESNWHWLVKLTNILWFLIDCIITILAYMDLFTHLRKIGKIDTLANFLNSGCTDSNSELPYSLYEHFVR